VEGGALGEGGIPGASGSILSGGRRAPDDSPEVATTGVIVCEAFPDGDSGSCATLLGTALAFVNVADEDASAMLPSGGQIRSAR
jgi:hypothetical protein